ncbi:MAG: DUF4258 domain-containing protein [Dehalococcoidia bacterium]
MELRWTRHAREALATDQLAEEAVSEAILKPFAVFEQHDAIRYHAIVGDRPVGVAVTRGTFPPRVITVFALREEWLP